MFELIIFIIIVSFVLKSKNKNRNNKPSATPNVPRTKTQPTPVPGRTLQNKQAQVRAQQRPASNKPVQSKAQNKPEEGMSTTERLEAKALADDKKERIEKQRQRMENKKHYGSHNYAQKYVLGDPVPKGKKMVFCSYCNAENLIPAYSLAKDYNCYFCREEL